MKKSLAVLLLPLLLAACGKPADLEYNAAVAPSFLHSTQLIDTDMERLIRGEFDAGAGSHGDSPDSRIADLERNLNQVQQLQHSVDAGKFAGSLSHYYEQQIAYYQQLKRYSQTTDKAQKESLAEDLNRSYLALKAEPERILALQRQFLERSGMPN